MWFGLFLCGCGSSSVELLSHDRWQTDGCSTQAVSIEADTLELDTNACSPARASQALVEPVRAGDTLELVWWHDFLYAEEPADGYFRLFLDDSLIYEVRHTIPGPPQATTEAFESSAAGTWLTVEIDNHGSNTWELLRLTRLGDRDL